MKIFCSGIGGIGLSAYAALQNASGHTVSGSDKSRSALTDDLASQGIAVSFAQDGSALDADTELLVYSEAIPESAPERVKARECDIRQISYFAALGELTERTRLIAVCGTHGKSSTTAMAAKVFIDAGLDPTVVVGTKLKELGGRNWRKGGGDLVIVEACEYRRSFHYLLPNVILMLNADGDHFDAYSGPEEYREAFEDFLALLPHDGYVITHLSDPDCLKITQAVERRVLDADSEPLVPLGTPGEHMRRNAQLVLRLAREFGIDHDAALASLAGFQGTWRRMETKGLSREGATVVDDYAHHPKEIAATLDALREKYPDKRLVCLFQPHTHDRTLKLYDDFCAAFSRADLLLLTDVYEARKDIETLRVDMPSFAADIARISGVAVEYAGDLSSTEARVHAVACGDDLLVCMGAGTVTDLATRMVA